MSTLLEKVTGHTRFKSGADITLVDVGI